MNKITGKPYCKNYHAVYMRNKRKKMLKTDPIYTKEYIWVIEGGGKQMVFKNKKDIKIKKIKKQEMKPDCIKAYVSL